jgi:hypothetical protein
MFCLLQESIFLVPESVFKVWKTDLRKVKEGRREIPKGNVLTARVECYVQNQHKGSSKFSALALAALTFQRTCSKTKRDVVNLHFISLCNQPSAGSETKTEDVLRCCLLRMRWQMSMRQWQNDDQQGKSQETWRRTFSSDISSTTNHRPSHAEWTCTVATPNRLSYGTDVQYVP